MPFHNDILFNFFISIHFLDIEQNIEKEEHSNKTSADLRIRKTQVSSYLLPVIQVQGSILYEFLIWYGYGGWDFFHYHLQWCRLKCRYYTYLTHTFELKTPMKEKCVIYIYKNIRAYVHLGCTLLGFILNKNSSVLSFNWIHVIY